MSAQEYAKLRELVSQLVEGCGPGPWHGVESGDKAAYSWWLENPGGDASFPEPDDVATMLDAVPGLLDEIERLWRLVDDLGPAAERGLAPDGTHRLLPSGYCPDCAGGCLRGFANHVEPFVEPNPFSAPGQVGAFDGESTEGTR